MNAFFSAAIEPEVSTLPNGVWILLCAVCGAAVAALVTWMLNRKK